MRRFGIITGLVLLWLILCVLFLTGCHITAPIGLFTSLGGALEEAAEYTFIESLFLFVSTDYGEFCAIVACFMATHLIILLKRSLFPWLQTHAPRLARAFRGILATALASLKRVVKSRKSTSTVSVYKQLEQLLEEAEDACVDTASQTELQPSCDEESETAHASDTPHNP